MKKLLLAILLSSSLFFGHTIVVDNSVQPVFAQEEDDIQLNIGEVAKYQEVIGTTDYDPDSEDAGFGVFLSRILSIITTIAALLLLLYLLWGGIEWISSGGDKSKIEKARGRITQAIVGMLVLAAALAIFTFMQSILGFEVITFGGSAPSQEEQAEEEDDAPFLRPGQPQPL